MALIENKKAKLRCTVLETYSAGMELTGSEVKALRAKMGSLDGARVVVRGGEAYLVGATIPPYQTANVEKGYDPARTRRLLLKKDEIAALADAESKKGLTTVPLEVYNERYIKVRVGIVRGKGKGDRREELKKKEADKEAARALKRKLADRR
ncbi:SsrA-binding protein SmpB [Candidatus Parcubacteria bacterium]|nr:SsrA-binding protein SmpB [Candidatus Parcubacteria bacterium]